MQKGQGPGSRLLRRWARTLCVSTTAWLSSSSASSLLRMGIPENIQWVPRLSGISNTRCLNTKWTAFQWLLSHSSPSQPVSSPSGHEPIPSFSLTSHITSPVKSPSKWLPSPMTNPHTSNNTQTTATAGSNSILPPAAREASSPCHCSAYHTSKVPVTS